jgi:hypothetical protein
VRLAAGRSHGKEKLITMVTYEGFVEGGKIRLRCDAVLPEHAQVHVIVPDSPAFSLPRVASPRVMSPRLVRPSQVADFELDVSEAAGDAIA